MKEISSKHFFGKLYNKKKHFPLGGQIETTYRCNLNCIHCYCKGLEDKNRELNISQWKGILDKIKKEGCVSLVLTGGEPLIRDDFLELYSYAKKKGFIITIFTNGQTLSSKTIDYLARFPPYSIEITLNGITEQTYEAITQIKGSFSRVMENIKKIEKKKIALVLKSNCLKQNKNEMARIKVFTDKFLGKRRGRYHFKYDPMIYPRLNGDKTPTNFRLSFQGLRDLRKQDKDIRGEYEHYLNGCFADRTERERGFLYRCNAWMTNFFINPYGVLKFCNFSEKFSIDLKTTAFKEGFYRMFPKLLNEKFKTNSKCKDCRLRPICYHCPARAYLETGNEEAPVEYYCQLARETARRMAHNDKNPALS